MELTLIVVVLVIRFSIKHTEDLEDVTVAIIPMELIASAIEAQDQLLDAS
jgi:hypothetical protein